MIEELQEKVEEKKEQISKWLLKEKSKVEMPVYSSFDVRDNGTKAAVIDSNLFPAGFNNLNKKAKKVSSDAIREYLNKKFENVKSILIIPESFTRNKYYLQNVLEIKKIIENAGYKVAAGTLMTDFNGDTLKLGTSDNETLELERLKKINGKIKTSSLVPDLILLNNDFSVEVPEILKNLSQKIRPPFELGWHHRKKSRHFSFYDKLIKKFAKEIKTDPWFLMSINTHVDNMDFKKKEGFEKVRDNVNEVLEKIKEKYKEYGLKDKPFVFVKDNSGTYGMGILKIEAGEDIMNLNSVDRRKMSFGKGKSIINSVIIQEGISTKFDSKKEVGESVIYTVGGKVVGGFMRLHSQKSVRENINSPGMRFDELMKDETTDYLEDCIKNDCLLSIYGILSEIANIAIGYEMKELER